MTSHPPGQDPWLSELLQAEKQAPGPSAELQSRLWSRLEQSIASDGAETTPSEQAAGETSGMSPESAVHASREGALQLRPSQPPGLLPDNMGLWMVSPMVVGTLLVAGIAHIDGLRAEPMRGLHAAGATEQIAANHPSTDDAAGPVAKRVAVRAVAASAAHAQAEGPAKGSESPDDSAGEANQEALRPAGAKEVAALANADHATQPPPAEADKADATRRKPRRKRHRKVARPAPKPQQGGTAPAPKTNTLREELRLVRAARSALGNGNTSGALRTLADHAQRFPVGQLSEERAALRVVALAKGGATKAARTAAQSFHQRYPHSMQSRIVQGAIAQLP
ncbi:MAG: hypothetical protein KC502_21295 [Myxococcales bacterium]|nr:hypothetical protein [Myxococcales bacterium]